jgi:hypothetical protein
MMILHMDWWVNLGTDSYGGSLAEIPNRTTGASVFFFLFQMSTEVAMESLEHPRCTRHSATHRGFGT